MLVSKILPIGVANSQWHPMRHEESDDGPPAGGGGGRTVLVSSFHYRVPARKGQWKVEAAFLDGAEGKPWHFGFVCHHVD